MPTTADVPDAALPQSAADDLTTVIPTFERPALLAQAIRGLLDGRVRPARILISEGSKDQGARRATETLIAESSVPGVEVVLLPEPGDGRMCANRNHLIRAVQSAYVLILDDELVVYPHLIDEGVRMLRAGAVDVIDSVPGPLFFTFRGHWTRRRPAFGSIPAISTRCLFARTELLQAEPFDEAMTYGSEEGDLAVRLYARTPPARIGHLPLMYSDLGEEASARYDRPELARLQVDSRILFGIRRYWDRRPALAAFLGIELASSCAKRQPMPREVKPGQWRSMVRRLTFLQSECP